MQREGEKEIKKGFEKRPSVEKNEKRDNANKSDSKIKELNGDLPRKEVGGREITKEAIKKRHLMQNCPRRIKSVKKDMRNGND